MARVIVKVGWKLTMEGVRKNAEYIGFRAREHEEEEKGFFNARFDSGADYERFLHNIETHPALQHEKHVKAHTMILSLREADYQALVQAGGNFKDIARDFMKDLEARKGMQLDWIGAFHNKSGHPHIHLSIASVGVDAGGNNRRLRINKEDLGWLPKNLEKKLEAYVPDREKEQTQTKTQRRSRGVNRKPSSDVSKVLESLKHDQEHKLAAKTNQRRRKRRAKSRQQQQRQAPPISPQH